MTEPCENCGTPVEVHDFGAVARQLSSGAQVLMTSTTADSRPVSDLLDGPALYEVERSSRVRPGGSDEMHTFTQHTPERCRALKRAVLPGQKP